MYSLLIEAVCRSGLDKMAEVGATQHQPLSQISLHDPVLLGAEASTPHSEATPKTFSPKLTKEICM